MAEPAYSRVLLKISGEALAGGKGLGFDFDTLNRIAGEIKQVVDLGTGVGLVIGGGNIIRGALAQTAGPGRRGLHGNARHGHQCACGAGRARAHRD